MKEIVRILVVEDERKLANALNEGLEADEYNVQLASTGEEGFYLLCKQSFRSGDPRRHAAGTGWL